MRVTTASHRLRGETSRQIGAGSARCHRLPIALHLPLCAITLYTRRHGIAEPWAWAHRRVPGLQRGLCHLCASTANFTWIARNHHRPHQWSPCPYTPSDGIPSITTRRLYGPAPERGRLSTARGGAPACVLPSLEGLVHAWETCLGIPRSTHTWILCWIAPLTRLTCYQGMPCAL